MTAYFALTTFVLLGSVFFLIWRRDSLTSWRSVEDRVLVNALESVGEPVFLIDGEKRIVWGNITAERVLGRLPGKKCREVLNCGIETEQACPADEVCAEGRVHSTIRSIKTRSGEETLFLITTSPVRDEKAQITHVAKSFRDISQIRKMEVTAASQELRYMRLFENMLNGFAYYRVVTNDSCEPVDWIFLEVNAAFERLTGLRRQEIVGSRVTQALPMLADSGFDWIGILGRVGLTGEPTRFEQYSEPLRRWFTVSSFSPEPGTFAVVFEDTTGRKAREQSVMAELEEREVLVREMHRRILENLHLTSRILQIQAGAFSGKANRASGSKAFQRTRLGLASMELIQITMQRQGDFERVSMSNYVNALIGRIREEMSDAGGGTEVRTRIPRDLTLDVDTATTCGLILTEFLARAFQGEPSLWIGKRITMTLKKDGEGRYLLEAKGEKSPGAQAQQRHSRADMGELELVHSCVKMLDGEFSFSGPAADTVSVSFPAREMRGATRY